MKKDRTTTLSRAPHPGNNVHPVIPTLDRRTVSALPVMDGEEHERAKEPLPTRPPRKHPQGSIRTVLGRFPAGAPRGSWPAEEYAAARRTEGLPATVVMDLPTDEYLVVVKAVTI